MQQKLVCRICYSTRSRVLTGLLILAAAQVFAWSLGRVFSQSTPAAQETWYLYRIAGHDVGRLHETVRRAGNEITTTFETRVIINRLGNKVEIKGKATFTETADGHLRSARSEMSSSQQATRLEAEVEKDKVVLRVSTGGKEYRRELPYSGAVLGPRGIRRRSASELKKPGDTLACQTLIPETERLATITRKLLEANASLPTLDKKAVYIRVEEKLEGFPGVRTVWLDDMGLLARQTESGPFGDTEIIVTDRATALRAGGALLPAEMFDQTLVRANIRLPAPRFMDRMVVRLQQKDPKMGWPDFAGPGQTILRREGKELLLEVRQVKVEDSTRRPVKVDKALREYLQANALLQSDDTEVQRIAREVASDEMDAFRTACRLRDWVHLNMKFDLGIALAPATEVIRQRKGTCAAYAIAFASLARAVEIPSRVVMGYAYVAGIWGGHAWVEVWTGKRWVPLDAAMPSPGPVDAARIACVRTSLAEGPGPLLSALTRVFAISQVSVVEYDLGRVATKVPQGAASFSIKGDTYRNPWLRLTVQKPEGFRFIKTDAVYPDTTVVGLEGPAGDRVYVRQEDAPTRLDEEAVAPMLRRLGLSGRPKREESAGRTVLVAEHAEKGGLAFTQGQELWILTAEGPHAGEWVRRVAASVKFNRHE